jgi:glutamyl-tRNA synthetase
MYRGRIAPTPTGLLHLGHGRTFYHAWLRARQAKGVLIYRNEDLDQQRCKPEFSQAAIADLRWLGLDWDEGPDVGGDCGPYNQSERMTYYLKAWQRLRDGGWIYPCKRSRKDIANATVAPHPEDEMAEPLFPIQWRGSVAFAQNYQHPQGVNWRFQVPDGEAICFTDAHAGAQAFTAMKDFGDFLVWRRDNVPAYELAVVVDDAAMNITEVVRGEDLLLSTARQLLLYRALGYTAPCFCHLPLMRDANGKRLAKRTQALALSTLREQGMDPAKTLIPELSAQPNPGKPAPKG